MDDLIPICDDHSYKAINRLLLEKALRCPECGAHQTSLFVMSNSRIVKPSYLITCNECKYQGPFGKNVPHAVDQWNKPPSFFATLIKRWKKKRAKKQPQLGQLKKQWAK